MDTLDLSTKFDKIDFVKHRKKFYTLSIIILVVGIAVLSIFKLNLGIDFKSGTIVEISSDEKLTEEVVETFLVDNGFEVQDIVFSNENHIAKIRYVEDFTKDETLALKEAAYDRFGQEPNVSTVTPLVGKELVKNALYALSIAALGIVIYVAIRFEWRMGLGAIISLLHDVFFMVAIFSLLRMEVDITFVAAVLTIVGYSINDTIVTFDRIRENIDRAGVISTKEELANIVNKSLRQTMARSINTILTVIVVVVALVFLGAPSIQGFSIALLIGLVTGMYSSICIAVQVWYSLKSSQMNKSGGQVVKKEKKQWGSDEPVV